MLLLSLSKIQSDIITTMKSNCCWLRVIIILFNAVYAESDQLFFNVYRLYWNSEIVFPNVQDSG